MNINPAALNGIYKAKSPLTPAIPEGGPFKIEGVAAAYEAAAGKGAKAAQSQDKLDTVSISSQATQKREVGLLSKGVLGEIAMEDAPSRVEAIKGAIARGDYQVPAAAVADAILGFQQLA